MISNLVSILSTIAVAQSQIAVSSPFYGRYYAAAKPILTPGFASVAAPLAAPLIATAAISRPAVAVPAFSATPVLPAPAVRPILTASGFNHMAAVPSFAPVPVVAPAPVSALPPATPVMVASAPSINVPAMIPALPSATLLAASSPVLAPPVAAVAPAYAPFARSAYFIGSNKAKDVEKN
uniref:Calphotin-like n=1 Tax=Heterorhabditis bacteriophora TaxID=37862 RepID=A0A1I7XN90_HETBA